MSNNTLSLKELLPKMSLFIFDVDGVLVDVSQSYRKAIKMTVEHFYQKEIDPSEIQALKNETGFNNDWDLTEELLKRKSIYPKKDEIIEVFQSFYWGNNGDGLIQNEAWLLDHSLIEKLSQQYKLAILTGRPKQEANFVLENNNVKQYFNPILAMEDVTKGKPDPEGLNKICSHYSCDPKLACYFGDTFDDVRCSVRAEVNPVGVIPPNGSEDLIKPFQKEGAISVLKRINDLTNYI